MQYYVHQFKSYLKSFLCHKRKLKQKLVTLPYNTDYRRSHACMFKVLINVRLLTRCTLKYVLTETMYSISLLPSLPWVWRCMYWFCFLSQSYMSCKNTNKYFLNCFISFSPTLYIVSSSWCTKLWKFTRKLRTICEHILSNMSFTFYGTNIFFVKMKEKNL